MTERGNGSFDDGGKLCLLSFFVLGNYFALFGLRRSSQAVAEFARGNAARARSHAKAARAWTLWGLIPSTAINVALIWAVAHFFIAAVLPLIKNSIAR